MHLNNDDSTYLPSVGTNNHVNKNDNKSPQIDATNLIVVMRSLLDPDNLKVAIIQMTFNDY